MKKNIFVMLFTAMLLCMHTIGFATELLDVKPVVAGDAVSIEVSADIAMTYTYYKIPGQARAVVDIAEADPEKVEPLIVVNKGAVSSISVDKAQIAGIVVSRIIFNLVSEYDIAVTSTPDRKRLTVTFGKSSSGSKAEPKPAAVIEPVSTSEQPVAVAPLSTVKKNIPEEDPLGLEESASKVASAPPAVVTETQVAETMPRPVLKLEPVVPAAVVTNSYTTPLSIKEIVVGKTYIEIHTNQPVETYKSVKLSDPDRLVIDIACNRINQKAKTVTINKFGISKARIGIAPKNIRIVMDSSKIGFPVYTVSTTSEGIRVTFK